MFGADAAHHLQTVEVRQHHVEHDGVGFYGAGRVDGVGSGGGGGHLPALVAHGHGQQFGQAGFVIDGEDPQGGAVGAGQGGTTGYYDFLLKPTNEKYQSETNAGVRLHLAYLSENEMRWEQTVRVDGKPFIITINFTKNSPRAAPANRYAGR